MKIKKCRENKGISLTDTIIAILILSLFVGVIGSLYYQIASHISEIRMNAMAVHYSVKIAEDTDKMLYEEVNQKINETINTVYDIPEGYDASIEVENYQKDENDNQDIIKIVTITIHYDCLGESKDYTIRKLKVKELL